MTLTFSLFDGATALAEGDNRTLSGVSSCWWEVNRAKGKLERSQETATK